MRLRPAVSSDADWIAALEAAPAMFPFIAGNAAEEHRRWMADAANHYLIAAGAAAEPLAYAILNLPADRPGSVHLRRVAVPAPGLGTGRAFLALVIGHVFGQLAADRLTLMVFEDNRRARQIYARLGFAADPEAAVEETVRRDGTTCRLLPLVLTPDRWPGH